MDAHMSTTIPPGYALVPIEPTPEMLHAAVQAICYGPEGGFTRIAGPYRCWAAMLAAAQQAAPAAPVGAPSERWRLALSVCDAALGQCQPCAEANCGVVQRDYIDTARAAAAALLRPATPTPPGEAP
jgi:hypothetical protein